MANSSAEAEERESRWEVLATFFRLAADGTKLQGRDELRFSVLEAYGYTLSEATVGTHL